MEQIKKELVIIGSGPAGLSAAVYAKRAMMDVLVIEKEFTSGGQIINTERIDNYLGFYGANGYDLALKFREHADALSVPFMEDAVTKLVNGENSRLIVLESGQEIEADAVILATGAKHRLLGAKGEAEFAGAGVSYCATCDGAFFQNGVVAVVGGGDTALEDALYLSGICQKVYLIHRREELRGAKILQEKVKNTANIEFMPFYEIKEIFGTKKVAEIELVQNQTGEISRLTLDGVFVAIGMEPENELVKELVDMEQAGYVVAGEDCRTSVSGIYAIGDIRTKELRQVVTAVADGATVIHSIEQDFIKGNR